MSHHVNLLNQALQKDVKMKNVMNISSGDDLGNAHGRCKLQNVGVGLTDTQGNSRGMPCFYFLRLQTYICILDEGYHRWTERWC